MEYASSINKTPPLAAIKASRIADTQQSPSKSIPPRSTKAPLFNIPFSLAMAANNLATVVLALPGFPPNIMCIALE